MRWEIFPMFGKPTIGDNQQRWDSVALGFEPAIANLFDASRNPQSRERPLCEPPARFKSGRRNTRSLREWSPNRDRGEPRGSSPPTPPYVRVRIRRFAGLSTDGLFCVHARGSDGGLPRAGFGPSSSAVRASPFPTAPKASDLGFLPHGQLEISTSKRLSCVQAFSETRSACRVGGGALDCSCAGLRPPHKLDVQFSRIQLS